MESYDNRVKSVEKIIKSGYVRHDEIEPALKRAGLDLIKPDEISDLVRKHKYRGGWLAEGRVGRGVKRIGDKIGTYVSVVLGAAVVAEMMAAAAFADSLIGEKIQGFGEHLLFWLGLRKIEISGPEMVSAMARVGAATPRIVKGMIIGAVVGYVAWKVITRLIGYSLKRQKRRNDINRLLSRYSEMGQRDESPDQ
jgi:hypothetical protein